MGKKVKIKMQLRKLILHQETNVMCLSLSLLLALDVVTRVYPKLNEI
jgi:hypothetical protein